MHSILVTCSFRKEPRPEDDVIELVAGDHSTKVCKNCLVLLTVHRRIHHMKIEKVVTLMDEPTKLVTEV